MEATPSELHEHAIEVRRTARYYTLGSAGEHVRDVWIVCHGYGQLAAPFLEMFRAIEHASRLIVAPEALNRYYVDTSPVPHGPDSPVAATWMTREDRLHEIDDYVAYLDTLCARVLAGVPAAAAERLTVLGFSQGGATVSRWASRTSHPLEHVVLWGSWPASELTLSATLFGRARCTLVLGERDRLTTVEGVVRQRERMDAAALRYRLIRFPGGHRLDDDVLRRLATETRPAMDG